MAATTRGIKTTFAMHDKTKVANKGRKCCQKIKK